MSKQGTSWESLLGMALVDHPSLNAEKKGAGKSGMFSSPTVGSH